jgi:hypothetical protein
MLKEDTQEEGLAEADTAGEARRMVDQSISALPEVVQGHLVMKTGSLIWNLVRQCRTHHLKLGLYQMYPYRGHLTVSQQVWAVEGVVDGSCHTREVGANLVEVEPLLAIHFLDRSYILQKSIRHHLLLRRL